MKESAETYPKVYLYRRIVQAKLFIDANFANNIDLNNISDEAIFSKFHFIRLFRNTYGLTPHQYLTKVRIDHSRHLLSEGMGVAEVCFKVGFESVSSFTGLFKRRIGVSPSVYKANQEKLQIQTKQRPLTRIPGCFAEAKGWK